MEFRKTIILLMLAIFLLSITSVCASEIDTPIASEDTSQIGLSDIDKVDDDNPQTSEEKLELGVDESLNEQTDTDVLGDSSATYSDLATEISESGNVVLKYKNYTYDDGASAITVREANKVIDGNGAVIDMAGSAIRAFTVYASDVTIKNLTIKNVNYNGDGGAIYFSSTGTVTNCNFADNEAYDGGAVYFLGKGTVENCNFTDNHADYGGALYFEYGSTGTVTNCNFTDNTARYGGAIRFSGEGTVTNCNFANNKAIRDYSYGGAIYMYSGSVENCNFTNNQATYYGGAILMSSGSVENCNFTDNEAYNGGAIRFGGEGTVTNCNFVDNSASRGGAIFSQQWYTSADTCIFKGNSGEDVNIVIYPPALNVDNFTTFYGSGEKLTFDLRTNLTSIPVTNGNISISVYFKDKNSWVGNYSCLSGEGWIPELPVGSYYAIFYTEYAEFQPINRTITITIPNVKYYINVTSLTTNNKTVNITAKSDIPKDILWDGKLLFLVPNSDSIIANYAGNGTWWTVHTFDDYGNYQVNATYVGLDNVTINNATISISKTPTNITVENTTVDLFVGGSVATGATLTPADAGNLTFTSSNSTVAVVEDGKIIALSEGTAIITVSFAGDNKYAVAENKTISVTVTLNDACVSVDNSTLDLFVDDTFTIVPTTTPDGLTVTFVPDDSGVYSVDENGIVTALKEGKGSILVKVGGDGIYAENSTIVNVTVSKIPAEILINITSLDLFVGDETVIAANLTPADAGNVTFTSSNESVVYVDTQGNVIAQGKGQAIITLSFAGNNKYAAAENRTITATVNKQDTTPDITIPSDITFGDDSSIEVKLPSDAEGNVTLKVDGKVVDTVPVTNGTASVKLPELSAGNHSAEITYSGDDKYKTSSKNTTFTVNKASTKISAAGVTATYKVDKYLVIKLTDSKGNPMVNAKISVNLNGAKDYTTDKNDQVKIKVSTMVPKTYTAKITFAGNENYTGSSASAKVVVKKATPKITATNKMFKTTTKTKKYTITLKDNTGKAIRNAKVTLKVNGKTYKAATNSKGKATFKITKLNKKGTFNAVITYKGSKYYNKASKKVSIKVISAWKTVQKGSKLKSTVKEIQRALKNNGYYLTAYGHYLKVDGIYWDYTVKAVKQFQKAKGLKVTGKVDEKTAKKLGII